MNDEPIENNSWFSRNWKWLIPIILIFIFIAGLLSSTSIVGKVAGMAKIHSESSVCDDALEIAKKDEMVVELLGELQPLGKLAIIEGYHKYSNDYNRLEISVNVTGSKMDKRIGSKMDILAERNGDDWIYKTINIRIKKPEELKQTIKIVPKTD